MHLFVEHLTVIDCAYLCPENGLVGESWIADITLTGALDAQSMVMDFALVKKQLKAAIDQIADHTLIVPTESPQLVWEDKAKNRLRFEFGNGEILTHQSPSEALCLLPAANVTARTLAAYLVEKLKPGLPKTVSGLLIELRCETGSTPYFHYVHGLKKHAGNCQRIAHGHRSRIKIWRNDEEDRALAAMCARELDYKYIATKADVVTRDLTHLHFAYTAPQGQFSLSYPTDRCIVIESDTTIECIAVHIAQSLKEEYPKNRFAVRAYEGVMKGAVAEA